MEYYIDDIFERLGDDESKSIFEARIEYSINKNIKTEKRIAMQSKQVRILEQLLREKNNQCEIYLYGAGIRGKNLAWLFKEYWNGVLDKTAVGKIDKLEIKKPYEVTDKDTAFVVISNKYDNNIIRAELEDLGYKRDNIYNFGEKYTHQQCEQYFDFFECEQEQEIFVDCGAYDGETSVLFKNWCNGKFKHIYAFEPDCYNAKKCFENIKENGMDGYTTIIQKGTWSKVCKLPFSENGDVSSYITEESDVASYINATTIDEELKAVANPVTFIKMDIEGAELETLKGARGVITTQSPKLAIAVYHKPEDIITIPEYLLSLNSNYKFYLRHYTFRAWDTVLYAVIEK